ncbi:hypothetical protein [Sporosarcina sp. E16_8]|nr:hypothetical protein [Sporosarcina sp. E16_8]
MPGNFLIQQVTEIKATQYLSTKQYEWIQKPSIAASLSERMAT